MRGKLPGADFDCLCREHGLAATHQRRVIFQAVTASPGHYSPEEVYAAVRKQIPSISLATVYKNLKVFVDSGILHEVSPHHGTLRVDPNLEPHHHLVCVRCKSITDLDTSSLGPIRLRHAPAGFQVKRFSVDVLGLCSNCAKE